jgi:hypothetical protein
LGMLALPDVAHAAGSRPLSELFQRDLPNTAYSPTSLSCAPASHARTSLTLSVADGGNHAGV